MLKEWGGAIRYSQNEIKSPIEKMATKIPDCMAPRIRRMRIVSVLWNPVRERYNNQTKRPDEKISYEKRCRILGNTCLRLWGRYLFVLQAITRRWVAERQVWIFWGRNKRSNVCWALSTHGCIIQALESVIFVGNGAKRLSNTLFHKQCPKKRKTRRKKWSYNV